jgi:hypothetical protein
MCVVGVPRACRRGVRAVRQLAGAVEVTEVPALAGVGWVRRRGRSVPCRWPRGDPGKRVPAAGVPSRSQRPWSYPSRRLVLGADAVEEVAVAAFGALLDDAGSAGGVGAYGLDGRVASRALPRVSNAGGGARRPSGLGHRAPRASERGTGVVHLAVGPAETVLHPFACRRQGQPEGVPGEVDHI